MPKHFHLFIDGKPVIDTLSGFDLGDPSDWPDPLLDWEMFGAKALFSRYGIRADLCCCSEWHPSEVQQALMNALPPKTTGVNPAKHYASLAELPDDICAALLPLAQALSGGGWNAIQAKSKLSKLWAMPRREAIALFEETGELEAVE